MNITQLRIGNVTVDSIIERDGTWRMPADLFPAYDPETARPHFAEMDDFGLDPQSGRIVITYQTFVLRTLHHTILVDTCTGEDKNYPAPMNFPKQSWLDGFARLGLGFEDIDYVFCTHLHIDHCGWNTRLVGGRWVPTFPKARYILHKREYAFWEAATARGEEPPGEVWRMNCLPVMEAGQALLVNDDFALNDLITLTSAPGHTPGHYCINIHSGGHHALVTGDLMHHPLQCREPDWSTIFCWDPAMAARTRRALLSSVADTDVLLLPIHFPAPTAGRVESDGARFRYRFRNRPTS
jgi:glyoxylase-like metal-dependent hydrolase (beta-lactamase superfamily II)